MLGKFRRLTADWRFNALGDICVATMLVFCAIDVESPIWHMILIALAFCFGWSGIHFVLGRLWTRRLKVTCYGACTLLMAYWLVTMSFSWINVALLAALGWCVWDEWKS